MIAGAFDIVPQPPYDKLTVAELERILLRRKQELEGLIRRRDRLREELAALDRRIAELQGSRPPTPVAVRRPRNTVSLRQTVVDLLSSAGEGFTLAQLADKILETGYQTSSQNFRNVLYQCLYNMPQVFHDEATGTYKLRAASI